MKILNPFKVAQKSILAHIVPSMLFVRMKPACVLMVSLEILWVYVKLILATNVTKMLLVLHNMECKVATVMMDIKAMAKSALIFMHNFKEFYKIFQIFIIFLKYLKIVIIFISDFLKWWCNVIILCSFSYISCFSLARLRDEWISKFNLILIDINFFRNSESL